MIRLEMLIADGLAGIAFPTFFSALLYELGVQSSPDLQLKFPANAVGTVLPLTIPFLAPPKLEWPDYLMKTALNVGTLAVERKETWTEMSFLDGVVSVECHADQLHLTPDTIKSILGLGVLRILSWQNLCKVWAIENRIGS
ncbi:hypothetical protein PRNP1_005435 [Phytophthora ramorum]